MLCGVLLDGLVWDFSRANTYRLDALFTRVGAKAIIGKCSKTHQRYLEYLGNVDRHLVEGDRGGNQPGLGMTSAHVGSIAVRADESRQPTARP